MNADRLKELRAFTMLLSHRCANNIRPDVGEAAAIEDLRALIDSALQPTGEVAEIVKDLMVMRDTAPTSKVRETCVRAIAVLSHPGEQQQLVEALAEAREIVTNFVGIAEDNGLNQRKYVSFGVRVNKFLTDSAALTAHKASDVPTAGDAALREAAKAGSKALRYLSGPNNSPTEREYSAHAQLLERFAEGSHG
jgi:hypothetical protein